MVRQIVIGVAIVVVSFTVTKLIGAVDGLSVNPFIDSLIQLLIVLILVVGSIVIYNPIKRHRDRKKPISFPQPSAPLKPWRDFERIQRWQEEGEWRKEDMALRKQLIEKLDKLSKD